MKWWTMGLQGEGGAIPPLRSAARVPRGVSPFNMSRVALAFIALAQVSAAPGAAVDPSLLLLCGYVVYSVLLLALGVRGGRAARSPAWFAADVAFLFAAAMPYDEASRVPLVALGTLALLALRPLFGLRTLFVILAAGVAATYAQATLRVPMPVLDWHGLLPYGLLLTGSLASVWWRAGSR